MTFSVRRLRPAALAAAFVLAGCSFVPTLERPAPPVPASFAGLTGAPATPAAADALPPDWPQFFTDPGLRALVTTALANNRDLRVALANVQQARAQRELREAERLPQVGAQLSGARQPNPATGQQFTLYQAGLALTAWELDFFGRVAALSQAAQAQYLATEEARRAAQLALVGQVATTWLSAVAGEELLQLTRETLRTREDSLRLVRLRFDNGVTSELELRQAQSLADTARVALAQQERQRAADLNALGLLTGVALAPDWRSGTRLADVRLPELPVGLPAQVLAQRPDVRQAEQQLVAANANIGAARAAFFPRITLTASAGRASGELGGLFDGSGRWAYTIAPTLLLPIFDAGRNRAGLATAQAQRDAAIAQYERAIQAAFREVADGLAGRATWGEQLQAQARVAEAETVRARLSQMRFDAGVASALELLDAQRSLFSARQAQIQTLQAQLQNQVLLWRTLGGGWRETMAP
jgi:NodT family efflux transporter outer membrane factor (OMF) lipoprotein